MFKDSRCVLKNKKTHYNMGRILIKKRWEIQLFTYTNFVRFANAIVLLRHTKPIYTVHYTGIIPKVSYILSKCGAPPYLDFAGET